MYVHLQFFLIFVTEATMPAVWMPLLSCLCCCSWAQCWLAELCALTKGGTKQSVLRLYHFRRSCANSSVLMTRKVLLPFLPPGLTIQHLPWVGCVGWLSSIYWADSTCLTLCNTVTVGWKEAMKRVGGKTALILQLDVAIPVDIAWFTVLQESLEQSSFNLLCKSLS